MKTKCQRATIACDKCRLLKSKVGQTPVSTLHVFHSNVSLVQYDGQQPVCARCKGYGYRCTWSKRKRGISAEFLAGAGELSGETASPVSPEFEAKAKDHLPAYTRAIQSYEALIQEFTPKLDTTAYSTAKQMLEYSGFCHSHGTKHWSPCRILF